MTTFVSSIPRMIVRTSIAAAFGIAILGGAAYGKGTTAQRHEQEMNQGKDHQSRDAASLAAAPGDSRELRARAKKHLDEMNKGKDHYGALDATRR
jgi:hypothetical protein